MTDETLGAHERHESPDYCDGGVTAAAIEEEAEVAALVTDEAVERGAVAALRWDDSHPDWVFEDISDEDQDWYRELARAVLTAALTVPTRPDGAEEIEAILAGSWPMDREGLSAAADDLAMNGVRVEGSGR